MGRKIVKNAMYLFTSHVLVRLLTAFATIALARHLPVTEYGILSLALAYSVTTAFFTEMGATQTLIREGTKEKADIGVLMSSYFRIRLIFTLGTALVSFIIIQFHDNPLVRESLYWMVFPTIVGSTLVGVGVAYFQVTQEMKYTAIIRTVSGILTAVTVFLAVWFKWPLIMISASYGFSIVAGGIVGIVMVYRKVNFFRGWNPSVLKGMLSFSIGWFLVMILPQLGPIILEKVANLSEVGYFAAANRIPSLLYQIPGILATAFYPVLFQLGNVSKDENFTMNAISLKLMSGLGMLIVIPFAFYPEWWIHLLLGDHWLPAANILRVLSYVVILQSINFPLADSLTTNGMQNRRTLVLLVGFLAGIGVYSLLGHRMGGIGGALSALGVEFVLLIGFTLTNKVGLKLLFRGARINVFVFAMIMALGLATAPFTTAMVGIPIYVLLFLLGIILLDRQIRAFIPGALAGLRITKKTEVQRGGKL